MLSYYLLVQDDAGSGAVHVMAGIAALIGAMMIGPRTDRFEPSLKKILTTGAIQCQYVAMQSDLNISKKWKYS